MSSYEIQKDPVIIPVEDNKIIREHFGFASLKAGDYSLAHMTAPAGWSEPFQTPEFDEITFVIKGRKKIEVDGDIVILHDGESVCIKKGTRVRYSNPFQEPVDYISVCIPAFTLERVKREE
jgi:ethanolamine utilization protein EutQ